MPVKKYETLKSEWNNEILIPAVNHQYIKKYKRLVKVKNWSQSYITKHIKEQGFHIK